MKIESKDKQALKAAQKKRESASGISPKAGGNLTLPGKWKGTVPDSNDSWGDWTNYAFPIHDLAHANNAASRIAQSSGIYSTEEISKIKSRIEKAQKKFNKSKGTLFLEDFELKIDAGIGYMPETSAPEGSPEEEKTETPSEENQEDEHFTKAEVVKMMDGLYSKMCSMMADMGYQLYDGCMNNDRSMAKQINNYIDSHSDGHMPTMEQNHIKAVLKAAGIDGDFHFPQMPIAGDPCCVHATEKKPEPSLKDIKIEVK